MFLDAIRDIKREKKLGRLLDHILKWMGIMSNYDSFCCERAKSSMEEFEEWNIGRLLDMAKTRFWLLCMGYVLVGPSSGGT